MPSFRANGRSLSHMNLHSSSLHAKGFLLSRCAALLLLSYLASGSAAIAQSRGGSARIYACSDAAGKGSAFGTPYLAVVLSPALTFQPVTPPVDPAVRLAAGAPLRPVVAIEDAATENNETAVAMAPTLQSIPAPTDSQRSPEPVTSESSNPSKKLPPVAILHDDMLREVRPEDVLPYFQFPGSVLSSPQPAPIPASSATYRQR